jgi:hypothetical protein
MTHQRSPSVAVGQIDSKIVAMSKQMGVSVETLKLIQTKSDQIKVAKEKLSMEMAKEDSQK